MNMDFKRSGGPLPGLPLYENGKTWENSYNAGGGLNAVFNNGRPIILPKYVKDPDYEILLNRIRAAGFAAVKREGAAPQDFIFDDGFDAYETEMTADGLRIRQTNLPKEGETPASMGMVTETTAKAFEAYIAALTGDGFAIDWQRRDAGNLFYELIKENTLLYAYFMARTGQARFILDPVSVRLSALGDGALPRRSKTRVCQFGLHYGHMIPSVSADCGMLYIVALPDGSLFLVDGGEYEQATDAACAEAMRLMRRLSGAAPGEKIPIAAWFCTHAHDDHMDLFGKLLRFHHDELDVKLAIFNFPDADIHRPMPQAYLALSRIRRYCPGIRYLKPHTGQTIDLGGVKFEFLHTHEDGVNPGRERGYRGFNDTSTVLKLSFDGLSFIFLGDMDNDSEAGLLSYYGAETLQCAGVQAAHHLINRLSDAYPVLGPDLALVPSPIRRADPEDPRYQALLSAVPADKIYFGSEATFIASEKDGALAVTEQMPQVGGEYDHSQV